MQEFARIASVVGHESLDESFAVEFPRRELESLREAGEPAQLWVELEKEGNGGPKRLTIDLTPRDIDELLRHPNGDDLLIALDGYALHGLFDDGDVEAHGLRGVLAIAVVAAGIAAPAGLAASPQATIAAGANLQVSKAAAAAQAANPASKAQVANPASKAQVSKAQVSKAAARAQVSKAAGARAQVSKAASKAQISKPATKAQISKAAAKAQISMASYRFTAAGIQRADFR
jgi:hypothetical protein